jgi:hypothetical protein
VPFYCEECLGEVTVDEVNESEKKYGHVFCKICQSTMLNKT